MDTIRTVGHGTIDADGFSDLLRGAGIELVVDIRRFPGSRHNPQFGQDSMASWLPAHDVGYRWVSALGGRRRSTSETTNQGLRNPQFRAYGGYMATDVFAAGVAELRGLVTEQTVAVMCSETVWWRCHRRLLADHLVLIEGLNVEHLFHGGRLTVHPVTPEARPSPDGVVYDVLDDP